MASGKSTSTNPIGQFKDEVVKIAKDSAKGVASEPKKILESILGKPSTDSGDQGIEDVAATAGMTPAQLQQAQQQQMQKKMQAQEDTQKKLQLHRQRLQEEQAYFEQQQRRKEMEEEAKEEQQEAAEKEQIIQLKKEQRANPQLAAQTHGRMGSKEQGRRKN